MGNETPQRETFYCSICERRLKRNMLSKARLKNVARLDQRLCRQCETFLNDGLAFIREKLAQKKLTYIPAAESDMPLSPFVQDTSPEPPPPPPKPRAKTRAAPTPRAASAVEREVFYFHSLSLERQIQGFIKGLEAAGMDRTKLSSGAETAINNLLQISQTLSGQRRSSQTGEITRADIRRMGRHLEDTTLMVNEYISAVAEESLEQKSTS